MKNPLRKKTPPKVVTPTWAQRIQVEEQQAELLITGWGHLSFPVEGGKDLLRQLKIYELRLLKKGPHQEGRGIYQLADAESDEDLVRFCRMFGPIWGEVRSVQYEDDGTQTIIVAQHMEELRREQRRFAAAVRLMAGIADDQLHHEALRGVGIDEDSIHLAFVGSNFFAHKRNGRQEYFSELKRMVLCGVLNQFPPQLYPFQRKVIELPEVAMNGIRSAVYFRLRLDFLAGRRVLVCPKCEKTYGEQRRGTLGCSPLCSTAITNRNQWSKKGQQINEARRMKYRADKAVRRVSDGTQKTR